MSQRFRAAVNRKRKSQARLHVARWSSQSVNIAFSLALFNRVWNNYTLRKSDRDTSFPRRYGRERRDCNVYNIYSYAISLIAALLSLGIKTKLEKYIFARNNARRWSVAGVTRWIRKWIRTINSGLHKRHPLKGYGRAPTLIISRRGERDRRLTVRSI